MDFFVGGSFFGFGGIFCWFFLSFSWVFWCFLGGLFVCLFVFGGFLGVFFGYVILVSKEFLNHESRTPSLIFVGKGSNRSHDF